VFGLGSVAADISLGVRFGLGARKRKRVAPPPPSIITDEAVDPDLEIDTMDTHTVVFGMSSDGDIHAGFKYDPKVLKNIFFSGRQSSRKRRRIDDPDKQAVDDVAVDASIDEPESVLESEERTRGVVLETSKERFLISPATGESGTDAEDSEYSTRRYIVSSIIETTQTLPKPVNGEAKSSSTKPTSSPVEPKPPPPTWSTPPTESERAATAAGNKLASKPNGKSSPPRRFSTAVLSNDRGQEHFVFMADGISIEGLETGDKICVKSWRWAFKGEFESH
jgi:hypothetical protein